MFCALHDQLASLRRHAQLARCFSAVAELLVILDLTYNKNDRTDFNALNSSLARFRARKFFLGSWQWPITFKGQILEDIDIFTQSMDIKAKFAKPSKQNTFKLPLQNHHLLPIGFFWQCAMVKVKFCNGIKVIFTVIQWSQKVIFLYL